MARDDEPPTLLLDPDMRSLGRDLACAVRGEVRLGVHDRMLYATDASLYQVEPLGVVIPADTDDAVEAVRFCHERGIPILPRGGGTSLAGQCTNRAVVIDFSPRCHALVGVDESAGTCRVEPGITIDDLNDRLSATRWFFAPDPATSRHCNIGGCIGNNAAGARSILYGRTSENLLAVRACLADGAVVQFSPGAAESDRRVHSLTSAVCGIVARHAGLIRERYPRTLRRNAGYGLDMILGQMESAGWRPTAGHADPAAGDAPLVPEPIARSVDLTPLLCGSEGTLAVTLGATLGLREKPRAKGLACLSFDSLDEAMEAVNPILTTGPSAVELLDDTVIDLARANIECRSYVDLMPRAAGGDPRAVLYVEYFSAQGDNQIAERFEQLRGLVPGVAAAFHTSAGAMLRAWKLRKAGEPLLHGIPGRRKPITFVEDNAVPVDRLPEFVREFRRIVQEHGTRAAFYAHASVGVLHVRPLLDVHNPADRESMRSIAVRVADLARGLGGVMSGEHGDGRIRGPLLERFYGPELMRAFAQVKAAFDPAGILNPGMIVPRPGTSTRIESITANLRVLPEQPAPGHDESSNNPLAPAFPDAETYFEYSDQHGFDGAVEMCNGAGVCRKKQGGTMCPSYQATLDERHSTRGRGNALRLAITGQFAGRSASQSQEGVWNDQETIRTLDWCLSCKACKTECPSNVDISRLKAEYTAQRYKARGRIPLRALVFGHVRWVNRLGSLTPGLANWFNTTRPARWVARRLLGIDPRRSIPAFERSLRSRWTSAGDSRGPRGQPPIPDARPVVVLLGDCFTMYNETGIGLATRRLFEALGYRVELADPGCCARAMISTGLLDHARRTIDATIHRLGRWIDDERVKAILVAEPSCLSAIKDDWRQLRLSAPADRRELLAERCFLPEDFADRAWESHPVRPDPVAVIRRARAVAPEGVLLHGHCHQKALWGIRTSGNLLERLFGDGLRTLDTGCCGMAGSFGFLEANFDLSMRIGELSLLPAARSASPRAILCAAGSSCRHQIHDAAGRGAVHPIELAAEVIAGADGACSSPA